MKIQIETQAPDAVQEFFSSPLSFLHKVTMKKLLIVELILGRMKALGLNRSQLAAKMEVSPARITTMLDGTNNFTIETLMRAAEAVDAAAQASPPKKRTPAPSTRCSTVGRFRLASEIISTGLLSSTQSNYMIKKSEFLQKYSRELLDGNGAVFVGSGLSITAGFVNWKDLLRQIASDLELDTDTEHEKK